MNQFLQASNRDQRGSSREASELCSELLVACRGRAMVAMVAMGMEAATHQCWRNNVRLPSDGTLV